MEIKGCICLDIDGTMTADPFSVPQEVFECLKVLYDKGWRFLFSTGRSYAFASKLFQTIPFPFFFSLQNGADLLEMPGKKMLSKHHLSSSFIPKLEALYQDLEEDFLIYSGWETGDFCYFRPHRFSLPMLSHLEVIQSLSPEPWRPMEEFCFPKESSFPLIKGLGSLKQMNLLHERLMQHSEIQATCIQDPLARGGVYLNLITAREASKGQIIKKLRSLFSKDAIFIGAGDDYNDISMLQEVDYKIVMKTAPQVLFSYADCIAEPAENLGLIEALWSATREG